MGSGAKIRTKRAYEAPERGDGYRVLIDHIWPRGVSKEKARLDEWAKELAPSGKLRSDEEHNNAVVLAELLRSPRR